MEKMMKPLCHRMPGSGNRQNGTCWCWDAGYMSGRQEYLWQMSKQHRLNA